MNIQYDLALTRGVKLMFEHVLMYLKRNVSSTGENVNHSTTNVFFFLFTSMFLYKQVIAQLPVIE